jgi:thiamine pyridinylase
VATHAVTTTKLTVGLYPYVPRKEQFQAAIEEAWEKKYPNVKLEFNQDWDGGYSQDPTGMDVFVFDAVFLDYFNKQGFLDLLSISEIPDPEDFLPYALEGVKVDSHYAALPMLGCTNILFYREADSAIENATTLSQLTEVVGKCLFTSQVPPDQRGLLIDMAGGSTNACMYVDIVESEAGQWPVPLPVNPDNLDPKAIAGMQALLSASSFYNATWDPSASYGRAVWFSNEGGRILMGFTESMSVMSPETRQSLQFKLFPMGDDTSARPLFYSDVIAVSASTIQRTPAVELAQMMASSRVLVASMKARSDYESPQYLMPVRESVFTALSADDPLYSKMQTMVEAANPILFNLGDSARSWIDQIKNAIKDKSRANYPCGCDQRVEVISGQQQAEQVCPTVCANFGGWNGNWTNYPPGATVDWPAGCGCKRCSDK